MTDTVNDTKQFTVALTTPCPNVTASVTLVSKTDLTVTVDVQMSPGSGASWKSYFPFIDWGDNIQDNPVSNGHNTHKYAAAGTYTIGVYGGTTCGKSNNATIIVSVTDPCAGITCNNTCDGTSLWSQECVGGHCTKKDLIESNSPTCGYVAPTPAQGQLEELDYPASVNNGSDMRVAFKIHNIGEQTGTFIGRLYQGDTKVGNDWRAVVHAGDSPGAAITVTSPATGTSASYTLKLFKET